MKGRKTTDVLTVIERANKALSSPDMSQAAKSALCVFLEAVLFDTGNYAGFGYAIPPAAAGFQEYNRFYYISKNL